MGRHVHIAALAAIALAIAPASAHAAVKAGVAEVDASWHVGASAGQYASDGSFVSDHGIGTRRGRGRIVYGVRRGRFTFVAVVRKSDARRTPALSARLRTLGLR